MLLYEDKLGDKIKNANYGLLIIVAVLLGISVITVFSAHQRASIFSFEATKIPYKHVFNILLGFAALFIAFCIPLKRTDNTVLILFFAFVASVMLFGVILFGEDINGAHRWIKIGSINFQPSEIAKIVLIFYVSHYIKKKNTRIKETNVKWSWGLLVVIGGIIALIAVEPDVSTALVLILLVFVFFFVGRVPIKFSFVLIMSVLIIGVMLYLLPGSRFKHIDVRINNYISSIRQGELNSQGNKQIENSILAYANGGFFGRGICRGELKNGSFIPEIDRDMIAAAIGEEMGLAGVILMMSLYFAILVIGFKTAVFFEDKDKYLYFLAIGISVNIFLFAIIHAFISIGALPATGLVLPFMSYGGTSMVSNMFLIGILLNISALSKNHELNENLIKKRELIFFNSKNAVSPDQRRTLERKKTVRAL
ncbi:FtsW/RodA/SpoVE family cell cycle protein [candidate division WOR-3 bacterium]|nr:FtsW/RodA/SpoVE family cell cycle protein [candidate division WOR-3 bacterium]